MMLTKVGSRDIQRSPCLVGLSLHDVELHPEWWSLEFLQHPLDDFRLLTQASSSDERTQWRCRGGLCSRSWLSLRQMARQIFCHAHLHSAHHSRYRIDDWPRSEWSPKEQSRSSRCKFHDRNIRCSIHAPPRLERFVGFPSSLQPEVVLIESSNIAGHSKKVTINALTLVSFATGNILGTQTFQAKQAPGYISGKISIIATLGALCFVVLILRWYNDMLNKKNEKTLEGMSEEEKMELKEKMAFADQTDRKNPFFKYTH